MHNNFNPTSRLTDVSTIKYGITLETRQATNRTAQMMVVLKDAVQRYEESFHAQKPPNRRLILLIDYYRRQLFATSGLEIPFLLQRSPTADCFTKELEGLPSEGTPILKLPFEVLSTIFSLAYGYEQQEDRPRLTHLPTVLSHVSRKFREVSISTARLWADIAVKRREPTDRLRTFLHRAGTCLLDVELDFPLDKEGSSDISQTIDLILPPSRWRSFTLIYRDCLTLHAALRLCQAPAPHLCSLTLVNAYPSLIYEDRHAPVDLFDADSVEHVMLVGVPVLWTHKSLTGLKRLDIEWQPVPMKPSTGDWTNLLRSSPALETLVIKGSGPYVPEDFDPAPSPQAEEVALNDLRELQLNSLRPNALMYLLKTITAPLLYSFELSAVLAEAGDPGCVELLTSSRYPALGRLKIVWVNFRQDIYLHILRAFPGVQELELYGPDGYLEAIAADDAKTTPPVLPQLRRLRIRNHSKAAVSAFREQRERLGVAVKEVVGDEYDETETRDALRAWLTQEPEA